MRPRAVAVLAIGEERLGNAARVAGEVGIIGGGPDAPTGLYATVAVQCNGCRADRGYRETLTLIRQWL